MPDKIHFRKLKKVGKVFYRIEGKQVAMVDNGLYVSRIEVRESPCVAEDVLNDDDMYCDCTEAEFRSAHADALAICTLLKIV